MTLVFLLCYLMPNITSKITCPLLGFHAQSLHLHVCFSKGAVQEALMCGISVVGAMAIRINCVNT